MSLYVVNYLAASRIVTVFETTSGRSGDSKLIETFTKAILLQKQQCIIRVSFWAVSTLSFVGGVRHGYTCGIFIDTQTVAGIPGPGYLRIEHCGPIHDDS